MARCRSLKVIGSRRGNQVNSSKCNLSKQQGSASNTICCSRAHTYIAPTKVLFQQRLYTMRRPIAMGLGSWNDVRKFLPRNGLLLNKTKAVHAFNNAVCTAEAPHTVVRVPLYTIVSEHPTYGPKISSRLTSQALRVLGTQQTSIGVHTPQ